MACVKQSDDLKPVVFIISVLIAVGESAAKLLCTYEALDYIVLIMFT